MSTPANERTWWQVFRAPIALAALTVAGLATALAGEQPPYRWFSWITLTVPPVVTVTRAFRRRRCT